MPSILQYTLCSGIRHETNHLGSVHHYTEYVENTALIQSDIPSPAPTPQKACNSESSRLHTQEIHFENGPSVRVGPSSEFVKRENIANFCILTANQKN